MSPCGQAARNDGHHVPIDFEGEIEFSLGANSRQPQTGFVWNAKSSAHESLVEDEWLLAGLNFFDTSAQPGEVFRGRLVGELDACCWTVGFEVDGEASLVADAIFRRILQQLMNGQGNPEDCVGIAYHLLEAFLDKPAYDRHHSRLGLDLQSETEGWAY
jgi:hypothetical protein